MRPNANATVAAMAIIMRVNVVRPMESATISSSVPHPDEPRRIQREVDDLGSRVLDAQVVNVPCHPDDLTPGPVSETESLAEGSGCAAPELASEILRDHGHGRGIVYVRPFDGSPRRGR